MRYRTFGRTDIELSEICFGAMRFTGTAGHVARPGGISVGEVENQNRQGRRALEAALDGGINCIHSSSDYGTRWMLGEVLQQHPKRTEIHHIVKLTSPDYEEAAFDAVQFRQNIEQDLRELHAERISLVQHLQRGPKVSKEDAYSVDGDARRIGYLPEIVEPLGEVVEELQEAGKIGHLISFPHTMGYARAALQTGVYAGIAHFLNLLETEALDLLDDLEQDGRGFLAIRPLLQGMLTDKRIDRAQLVDGDLKNSSNWDTRYALLARIREELGDPDGSWETFALQFALAHPAVTSVVTSASDEKQITVMLEAVRGEYPAEPTVSKVKRLCDETGFLSKNDLFVENLARSTEDPVG